MNVKVVGEFILVDIVEEPDEKKTAAGIIVPNLKKNREEYSKTKRCVVQQIGPEVEDAPFEVGDTLLIYYQAGLMSEAGHFIKKENVYAVEEK